MKEIKVTEKRYVCDNCGGKHKLQTKIFKDDFSGKEICSSCAKNIILNDLDIYNDCSKYQTVCEINEDNINLFNYIQDQLVARLETKIAELKQHLANNSLDDFIKDNNIDTKDYCWY